MHSQTILAYLSAFAAVVSASPVGTDNRHLAARLGPGFGGNPGGRGPPPPPGGGRGGAGGPGGVAGNPGGPILGATTVTSAATTAVGAATSSAVATSAVSAVTSVASSSAAAVDATPTLPVNGGSTELPQPTGLTLKYIAVGHGIQNYTCANASATGASIGALAVLYDVTSLFPGQSASSLSQADFDALPAQVLDTTSLPLNLNSTPGFENQATTPPFPDPPADLTVGGLTLPFLAEHFFNAAVAPTFDLSGSPAAEFFVGAKSASVTAPASADAGPDGTGAVAWLQLKDSGASSGLSTVYRVVTAGGNPTACSAAAGQVISVPYAAQYWFYD